MMRGILRWRFPLSRHPWLGYLTLMWLLCLFLAIAQGTWDRGNWIPPEADFYVFGIMMTYLGFLVGSLDLLKFPRVAITSLTVGILARAYCEFHASLLKGIWLQTYSNQWSLFTFAAVFYLVTFILPSLLLIDRWRDVMRSGGFKDSEFGGIV